MHKDVQSMLANEQRVFDRLNGKGRAVWEEEDVDLEKLWQHALKSGDYGKEYTDQQFGQLVRHFMRHQGITL